MSCHGDYDKATEQHYLAFEDEHELGMVDKLSNDRLSTLLKTNKEQ